METVETHTTAIPIDQSLNHEDPKTFLLMLLVGKINLQEWMILPFKIILTILQVSHSPVTHEKISFVDASTFLNFKQFFNQR